MKEWIIIWICKKDVHAALPSLAEIFNQVNLDATSKRELIHISSYCYAHWCSMRGTRELFLVGRNLESFSKDFSFCLFLFKAAKVWVTVPWHE